MSSYHNSQLGVGARGYCGELREASKTVRRERNGLSASCTPRLDLLRLLNKFRFGVVASMRNEVYWGERQIVCG